MALPFTPAGFGSSYGLYFEFIDQGIGGPPPHILNFTSISMALKADPGNHNGAVSSTVSGIGFANTGPTGEADDIVLATGSLVAGSLFLDTTTGILDGNTLLTFDSDRRPGCILPGWIGLARIRSPRTRPRSWS